MRRYISRGCFWYYYTSIESFLPKPTSFKQTLSFIVTQIDRAGYHIWANALHMQMEEVRYRERGRHFLSYFSKLRFWQMKPYKTSVWVACNWNFPLTGSRSVKEKWHLNKMVHQTWSFGKQSTLCFVSAHA